MSTMDQASTSSSSKAEPISVTKRLSDLSLEDLDLADRDILLDDSEDENCSGEPSNQQKRMKYDLNKDFDSEDELIDESSKSSKACKSLDDCTDTFDLDETEWFGSTGETCESVEAVLSNLEKFYDEERSLIVHQESFISTPLHALKQLAATFHESVHNEIMMIKNVNGKTLIRVEVIVGAFRGIGEAYFKRLATQMASIDLLQRVKKVNATKGNEITPYAIYPGWRIKPQVCSVLLDICKKNNLKMPKYIPTTNADKPDLPMYSMECLLGNTTVSVGLSDLSHVARKLAAYHAIEVITGKRYPMEYVAMGEVCTTYQQLVRMGCQPVMSDIKKEWMLDQTISNTASSAQRGINQAELDALNKDILEQDFQESFEKRKGLSVTFDVGSKKRNIRIG